MSKDTQSVLKLEIGGVYESKGAGPCVITKPLYANINGEKISGFCTVFPMAPLLHEEEISSTKTHGTWPWPTLVDLREDGTAIFYRGLSLKEGWKQQDQYTLVARYVKEGEG